MRNLKDRRYTLSKKKNLPFTNFLQLWKQLNWQKGPNCRSRYSFSTKTCYYNTGGTQTIARPHFFKRYRQTEEKHQGPAELRILMTSSTSQTSPWSFYLVCLVVASVMVWTEIKLPFNPPPLHMTSLWCASNWELWLVHIRSPLWPAANQNSSAQHPPPQGSQWWNKWES